MFIAEQFTIAESWKPPKCSSVYEWIKKTILHLQNGMLCIRKKEGGPTMGLENIMLSEINQGVRDNYYMISPLRAS